MMWKLIAAISSILIVCFLQITSLNATEPSNSEKVRIEGEIKGITDNGYPILVATHRVETKLVGLGPNKKSVSLPVCLSIYTENPPANFTEEDKMLNLKEGDIVVVYVRFNKLEKEIEKQVLMGQGTAAVLVGNRVDSYTSAPDKAEAWVETATFVSWDKDFKDRRIAENLKAQEVAEKNALKAEEDQRRAQAEADFQAAQEKMRIEEEKEKIHEQRIADLKSGKMKITNIEDAKLAFNPSSDDKYTYGLPMDGLTNTGQYYMWIGTLSWKSGGTYFCLDNLGGQTKCFGFSNVIVRFNEMLENSPVTVVGKLAGTNEVTLVNKLSGVQQNKTIALLTDCYVF